MVSKLLVIALSMILVSSQIIQIRLKGDLLRRTVMRENHPYGLGSTPPDEILALISGALAGEPQTTESECRSE